MKLLPSRHQLQRFLPQLRQQRPQLEDPNLHQPEVFILRPDGAIVKSTLSDIQRSRQVDTQLTGVGQDWAPTAYGELAAKSTPVYRAVTLRSKAIRSAPLTVNTKLRNGALRPVKPDHPAQMLLTSVNPWWTMGDLLEAT